MIHNTMNHVLFPIKSNFSTIQKLDVTIVWFLENQVEKNWVDSMIHHMLDGKNKNMTPPYGELIAKILVYTDFELAEEEP